MNERTGSKKTVLNTGSGSCIPFGIAGSWDYSPCFSNYSLSRLWRRVLMARGKRLLKLSLLALALGRFSCSSLEGKSTQVFSVKVIKGYNKNLGGLSENSSFFCNWQKRPFFAKNRKIHTYFHITFDFSYENTQTIHHNVVKCIFI